MVRKKGQHSAKSCLQIQRKKCLMDRESLYEASEEKRLVSHGLSFLQTELVIVCTHVPSSCAISPFSVLCTPKSCMRDALPGARACPVFLGHCTQSHAELAPLCTFFLGVLLIMYSSFRLKYSWQLLSEILSEVLVALSVH